MSLLKDQKIASTIRSHLEEQAIKGYSWVVYDTDKPISNQYDLVCYTDRFKAEDDAKEYQQIFSWHEAVTIQDMIFQLKQVEKNQSELFSETKLNQPNSTLKINNDDMDGSINRAKHLWDNWEKREAKIKELTGNISDKQTLKYKYQFLTDGLQRLSVNPSEKEKVYTHAIKAVTANLRKQLYPNPVLRFLHRVKHALVDKPVHLLLLKDWKKASEHNIGEELQHAGLGQFSQRLKNELDFEREKIDLKSVTQVKNGKLEIDVHLAKIDESAYRFNGYSATLTNDNGEIKTATFYPGNNINVNEALNLLQGRPIYKSLHRAEPKSWIQLEQNNSMGQGKLQLVNYSSDYQYDLKQALIEASISVQVFGLSSNSVLKGLEAGHKVMFEIPEKGKFYVSANPTEKSISFFDSKDKPISIASLKKISNPIKQNQFKGKDLKLIKQKDQSQENQLQVGS